MASKIEIQRFDMADYLGDREAQAAALSEALASRHKGLILDTLGAIARARGMSELARSTGVNRQTLYAALGVDGNPTLETLLAIVGALGLELHAEAVPRRIKRQPVAA